MKRRGKLGPGLLGIFFIFHCTLLCFAGFPVEEIPTRETGSPQGTLVPEEVDLARSLLRRVSDSARPEDLFGEMLKRVWEIAKMHPVGQPAFRDGLRELTAPFPGNLVQVWFFNADGKLLSTDPEKDKDMGARLETVFSWIRKPWKAAFRVPHDVNALAQPIFQGFDWKELISRPGKIHSLFQRDKRVLAGWKFAPNLLPGMASGVLLKINQSLFEEAFLARNALQLMLPPGLEAGFIDTVYPGRGMIPPGIDPEALREMAHRLEHSERDVFPFGPGWIVFVPCLEQITLFGYVPAPSKTSFPITIGFVVFSIGLMTFLLWQKGHQAGSVSVRVLLTGFIGLPGILILALALVYGRQFLESRSRAIVEESLWKLEERLTSIDQRFPMIIREKEAKYGDWCRRMDEALSEAQAVPMVKVFRDGPGEGVNIAPESVLGRLVKETEKWELDEELDTLMLIASSGILCRDHSDVFINIRKLAVIPPPQRWNLLHSVFDRQGMIDHRGNRKLFFGRGKGIKPEGLVSFRFFKNAFLDFTINWARSTMVLFNALKAPSTDRNQRADIVLGGLLESEGWTLVHQSLQMIGQFVFTGNLDMTLYMFPQILKGRDGKAQFALTFLHQGSTLALQFLRRVLPPEKAARPKVLGITFSRNSLNHPEPFAHRVFEPFLKKLIPPRVLHSEKTRIGGRETLLAALACRQIPNYYLVATLPFSSVSPRIEAMRRRFTLLATAFGLALAALFLRLWRSILTPIRDLMGAVSAMEERRLDHRVHIRTRDEFQEIGEEFNRTLAGMEELEVARLVQSRLLPQGPHSSPPWTFRGYTRMTREVGGDYFDVKKLPGGELAFIIADVSGHGVSAALVVAMAKAVFGNLTGKAGISPSAILAVINELFFSSVKRTKMMTCLVGVANPNGSLLFSNAGHCFPYILERGKPANMLENGINVPLGILRKARYRDFPLHMEPASHLLLYTDGIPEAVDGGGKPLGFPRLTEIASGLWKPQPEAVIDGMIRGLILHTGETPWKDDVTAAVLSLSPGQSPDPEADSPLGRQKWKQP